MKIIYQKKFTKSLFFLPIYTVNIRLKLTQSEVQKAYKFCLMDYQLLVVESNLLRSGSTSSIIDLFFQAVMFMRFFFNQDEFPSDDLTVKELIAGVTISSSDLESIERVQLDVETKIQKFKQLMNSSKRFRGRSVKNA